MRRRSAPSVDENPTDPTRTHHSHHARSDARLAAQVWRRGGRARRASAGWVGGATKCGPMQLMSSSVLRGSRA